MPEGLALKRGAPGTAYAPAVKRLRAFLDRLPGGHRPPTGPMTTAETADADELRRETLAKDTERTKREQEERDRREPEA